MSGISKSVLTEQLAAKRAEADRIAATFKVDEKGRFDIASEQYKDYRKAVAEAKEVKSALDALAEHEDVSNYLDAPEGTPEAAQGLTGRRGNEYKSLGDMFINSAEYKSFRNSNAEYRGQRIEAQMEGKSLHNYSVEPHSIPALGGGQDIGIFEQKLRQFHVRDLFPKATTKQQVLYGLRETGFIDPENPATQGNQADWVKQTNGVSPYTLGAPAPESKIKFETVMFPVAEIAHLMHAHKNILADEPRLRSFINGRLTDGLKFKEDQELLFGNVGAEKVTGIANTIGVQKYDGLATDKYSIQVRRAMTKALLAEYEPTGLVVGPEDWETLEIETDDTGAFRVAVQVAIGAQKKVWRVNVVETTAMPTGQFLLGSFGQGAQLYDREKIKVQVSTEHGTNFSDGIVSFRADQRLALVVERPESFVLGKFTPHAAG